MGADAGLGDGAMLARALSCAWAWRWFRLQRHSLSCEDGRLGKGKVDWEREETLRAEGETSRCHDSILIENFWLIPVGPNTAVD